MYWAESPLLGGWTQPPRESIRLPSLEGRNLAQSQALASRTLERGCLTREGGSLVPNIFAHSISYENKIISVLHEGGATGLSLILSPLPSS